MTWGAILLLVAYLVVFPRLFVLGPLAGLLLASRPSTFREWAWIGAALLWLGVSLWQPEGGLATQAVPAWALFVTGAFVVLMLPGRRSLVPGALLATVFGFGAATASAWLLGTRWHDIQLAVAHQGWESCRELLELTRQMLAQGDLKPAHMAGILVYVNALADGVGVMAKLFPGMLVLTALPGLALAWAWYHRLSSHPVGTPAVGFARFRFSDQLIWLVVACVAVFVLPLPDEIRALVGNVALVVGGLYAARGAAVTWGSIEPFPPLILLVIMIGVLFILPVALGGFFALGLADTWVDFRRRFPAADTEGSDPWK